jgi:hypothetical protein
LERSRGGTRQSRGGAGPPSPHTPSRKTPQNNTPLDAARPRLAPLGTAHPPQVLGSLVQRSGFSPEAALELHKSLYRQKLAAVCVRVCLHTRVCVRACVNVCGCA